MIELTRPAIKPHIEIESTWLIPEGATNPEFILPCAVMEYVVRRLELDNPFKIGIDPMCGNGTIPNFINEAGGYCYGIELNQQQCEIARAALAQIEPFNLLPESLSSAK